MVGLAVVREGPWAEVSRAGSVAALRELASPQSFPEGHVGPPPAIPVG